MSDRYRLDFSKLKKCDYSVSQYLILKAFHPRGVGDAYASGHPRGDT